MPACQMHDQKMEMHVDVDHAMMDMSHCDHHQNGDQSSKNVPCDKCFTCHLNVTQAIIPFNVSVQLRGVAPMIAGLVAEIPDSVPTSLFHPPRSTFA